MNFIRNTIFPFFIFCLFLPCVASKPKPIDYSKFVNPFIGTDYTGNTYPGASLPFGMVQLSPDNGTSGWNRISGYYYPDSTIAGFSHTHLSGTGAGDLYDISFFPVTLPYREVKSELGVFSTFKHDQEKASPGYYSVVLKDYNIKVELTATERCGIQRYTFPKAESAIFLNLKKAMNWDFTDDSFVEVLDSVTIRGYRFSKGWAKNQKVYFVSKFSKPFKKCQILPNDISPNHGFQTKGKGYVARFDYETIAGEEIVIRTAISAVDYDGAMRNLQKEAVDSDFEKYKKEATGRWNRELSKIQIDIADQNKKICFYTALYHTMLSPTIFSDVDGRYLGADQKIYTARGWTNYSTFSLWDTYRAAHPLYILMHPSRVGDMVNSLLSFADQNGRLPVWNLLGSETDMMIGYHSASVISEAYLKGIKGFDANRALETCVQTAQLDEYRGIGLYKKLGYVPCDLESESLSKTMEYSFDDYAIACLAKKLKKDSLGDLFLKRSMNYKNLYNSQTRFMQPKDSKGNFLAPFDPKEYSRHITESNGWQYFWSAPQDLKGLVSLTGGKVLFEQKLDSMFASAPSKQDSLPIFSTGMIGQYAHGNEPGHHVAYLYNNTGSAYKTQYYCHKIMTDFYTNTPGGLCGNEDCGQMSAWYVFSAMGFYPVDPLSQTYQIGTPLVDKAVCRFGNNKTFTIIARRRTEKDIYVKSVSLNGTKIENSYITHSQLIHGGVLVFEMSEKPCSNWFKN